MKNTALISLSFLVLYGVSACSTSSQKPDDAAKKASSTLNASTSVSKSMSPANSAWQSKQQLAAQNNEQVRLAYNYAWQKRQEQQKQQQANQARHHWNQQQAQKARQQQLQQQNQQRLAQQYAQQQMQKQARATAQRQQNQQTQYRAMLQQQQRQNTVATPRQSSPARNIASLSASEIRTIGDKIFRNESGGDIDKLVHWNVGENFASMGIGHFTWYPAGRRNRYGNTFPGLLDHLQANGVRLPAWVQKARYTGAPWRTKNELKYAKNSPQLKEFQNLLYQTRYLQASYIFERAKRAMPRLVKASPAHLRGLVAQNLNAVANTKGGWYALIDYVNFKGEGLNRRGGYKGQNWGLLQVLENMRPSQPGQMALNNFADSAIQVLTRRVRNSNPSRGESRWLRGWTIRCNTYRQPFVI